MKSIGLAAILATAFIVPAFAQDAATMVCSEYSAMDNAGKMGLMADLQAVNAEIRAAR